MAEIVYPPVVATAKLWFRLLDLRFHVEGAEHIPRTGGAVLASNHVGYLDFIFCGFAAQPSGRLVRFMAKDAVFTHKVSGPLMRGMHHIPVDREAGAASYQAAVAALAAGEIVGVFPEATISRSFQVKECKSGAARMAADAGVPLVPMVTWGGQRLWTKGRPKTLTRRHTPIMLGVGEPLRPSSDAGVAAAMATLTERMAQLLETAQRNYPDAPTGPDDRWWLPARLGGTAPTPEEAAAMDAAEKQARAARRRGDGGRIS
jgi:1-acyl-sn-glycerol-3-phosphate acyltransferase